MENVLPQYNGLALTMMSARAGVVPNRAIAVNAIVAQRIRT